MGLRTKFEEAKARGSSLVRQRDRLNREIRQAVEDREAYRRAIIESARKGGDAHAVPWASFWYYEDAWEVRLGGSIARAAEELPHLARVLGREVSIPDVNGGTLTATATSTVQEILEGLRDSGGVDLLKGRAE